MAKNLKQVVAKSASMSSKHFGKGRISLQESLQKAVIGFQRRPGRIGALGKPTEEVRVVPPAQVPKPKQKRPATPVRTKSSGVARSTQIIRADGPLGLPWVPGPPRKRSKAKPSKPNFQPAKKKVQPGKSSVQKKKAEPETSNATSRRILLHEGQPRFEGGIRFVQGGLPNLGKR